MRTLAMDCATKTIGLALLEEETVRAELYLQPVRHHSEVLLPAFDRLLSLAATTPREVELLACTVGPGSFTGVRIGVSTVKGLALAMSVPVAGVSTLETLAMNAVSSPGLICPLLDAGNNQVYAGLFRTDADGLPRAADEEKLIDIGTLLKDMDRDTVLFLGEGAARHRELIQGACRSFTCSPGRQRLMASAVGIIGLHRYRRGGVLDTADFKPRYLRPSEAERSMGVSAPSAPAGGCPPVIV
ncbi:MAG: tRNA (adenosine(37)-N6)-threonylcarbamoyltransferase complex dimerization subunit type 1 TsaB [Thermodesulfobacteriota bacterium]